MRTIRMSNFVERRIVMKILKSILFSLLIHFYMQIDILLQIKTYDSNSGVSDFVAFALPIIFTIVVYYIFKCLDKKEFWITTVSFIAIYVMFIYLGNSTNYFEWLFNLMKLNVFYDDTYYELGVNAMVDGLLHTIGFVFSSTIYLIKNRRIK